MNTNPNRRLQHTVDLIIHGKRWQKNWH